MSLNDHTRIAKASQRSRHLGPRHAAIRTATCPWTSASPSRPVTEDLLEPTPLVGGYARENAPVRLFQQGPDVRRVAGRVAVEHFLVRRHQLVAVLVDV